MQNPGLADPINHASHRSIDRSVAGDRWRVTPPMMGNLKILLLVYRNIFRAFLLSRRKHSNRTLSIIRETSSGFCSRARPCSEQSVSRRACNSMQRISRRMIKASERASGNVYSRCEINVRKIAAGPKIIPARGTPDFSPRNISRESRARARLKRFFNNKLQPCRRLRHGNLANFHRQ